MNSTNKSTSEGLESLNKLVGKRELEHQDLNTKEEWGGKDIFEWLPGGHFIAFHHKEDKGIQGVMILGFDKGWEETEPGKEIIGHWFENSSGFHYKYIWEVNEHTLQFWLNDKKSAWRLRVNLVKMATPSRHMEMARRWL